VTESTLDPSSTAAGSGNGKAAVFWGRIRGEEGLGFAVDDLPDWAYTTGCQPDITAKPVTMPTNIQTKLGRLTDRDRG
jgi:hypothetical protein